MVHRVGTDTADLDPSTSVVDDPIGPASGGLPFSTASVGDTDRAFQSGTDGIGADDDLVSDDTGFT